MVVDRLVAHAIAAYDPETHEDLEDDAWAGWVVTLTHPEATDFLGTSHLEAHGDTLVLKEFYDQVCAVARNIHGPPVRTSWAGPSTGVHRRGVSGPVVHGGTRPTVDAWVSCT